MKKCCLILFLLPLFATAQKPTARQIRNLYEAGRLWGNIKYFHPALQYRQLNWDSSFTSAVPGLLAAGNSQELAIVLQKMLDVLKDPATRVQSKERQPGIAKFTNTEKGKAWIENGVLVMRLNDKAVAEDFNETVKVTSVASHLLDSVNAVVFDLRITEPGSRLSEPSEMSFEFLTGTGDYEGLSSMLAVGNVALPTERAVVYQGFKPEAQGGADYAYQSYFRLNHSNQVNGRRTTPIRAVFLVNKNAAVPDIAIALQELGQAMILSEDPDIESRTVEVKSYQADSLDIHIRITELIGSNGQLSLKADSLLVPHTDYLVNLQTALALAAKPFPATARPLTSTESYTGKWRADVYDDNKYPDLGMRVLAAAKMYNVIRFFNPDIDLFDKNWDSVFLQYLPDFVMAKDTLQYMQAVAGMYAHMQDSHSFPQEASLPAWGDRFAGDVPTCVRVSKVEGRQVVSFIVNEQQAKKEGLAIGDIILEVDGKKSADIIEDAGKYFATSNKETMYRDINRYFMRGKDSSYALLLLQKPSGKILTVKALRSRSFYSQKGYGPFFRKELPVCTILKGNIGFIDPMKLRFDNVDSVMNVLRNTGAIILDDRCYPPAATQQLFNYLPPPRQRSLGYYGTVVNASSFGNTPGSFPSETRLYGGQRYNEKDHKWNYRGKILVLMNEWTQSAAEHTADGLIQRGAIAVGSHTAGANGDVSNFYLPGNIKLSFSGRRTSMQRTGIIPTVKVNPTIAGIVAGRDEVLDKAIEYAGGVKTPR